jgi:hypothetical protein
MRAFLLALVVCMSSPLFSQAVVVGDSLMCSLAPKIEARLGHAVTRECKVGSGIKHWTHQRPASDLMIVEIGTNDHGIKPAAYRKLVQNFLATANTKRILWIGIPPMPGSLGARTDAIDKVIVEETMMDIRVDWINPASVLGPGSRTPDGIHLTSQGAIAVANILSLPTLASPR